MATKRKMKPKTAKIVEGVRLEQAKEEIVRKAYKLAAKAASKMSAPPMKLPPADGLDLEGLVRNLVLWYRASTPADSLCDCTTCGGDSDSRLDACPFCGDSETDAEDVEEATELESVPEPEPAPAPAKPVKEPAKAKGAKPAKEPKAAEPEPAKPSKPATPIKLEKPANKAKPLVALDPPSKTNAPVVSRIVAVAEDGVEVIDKSAASVEALDESVHRVTTLKNQAAKGIWDIGVEIKRILDEKLWRLRLDANGEALYKTFAQFCKAELEMGYSHANRLMQVASTFPKELMERVGIAKCSIALHVPVEARAKLLDGAESKSKSTLSKEAQALKDSEKPRDPRVALTVAMAPGVVELDLVIRPKKKGATKQSDVKAKSIEEDPWAFERLPNNVIIYYALLRDREGNLVLRIDRRRVKSDEIFLDEPEGKDEEDDTIDLNEVDDTDEGLDEDEDEEDDGNGDEEDDYADERILD